MEPIVLFSKQILNWKAELAKDEWFFVRLGESIIDNLSTSDAFELIPEAVETVLAQENEHLCLEAFEILLGWAQKSDTTEIPQVLDSNWDKLISHVSSFSQYHKGRVKEFCRWYRRY